MKRWWCLLLVVGCGDVEPPEVDDVLFVPVGFTGTTTVSLDRLRVAAGAFVDVPAEDEEDEASRSFVSFGQRASTTTTATVTLPLQVPADPPPPDLFYGRDDEVLLEATQLFFFAYIDEDGDDAFALGTDTVLGVGGSNGYLHVPDRIEQLGQLGIDDAARYDRSLPPRFGSLVPAVDLSLTPEDHPVRLKLEPPSAASVRLACGRSLSSNLPLSVTSSVVLSQELDPVSVCGLELEHCGAADLNALTPPLWPEDDPEAPADHPRARCRRRSGLEAVVLETPTPYCELTNCRCGPRVEVLAFVVTSTRPAWWPCGTEVPVCDAPGSALQIPSACYGQP